MRGPKEKFGGKEGRDRYQVVDKEFLWILVRSVKVKNKIERRRRLGDTSAG